MEYKQRRWLDEWGTAHVVATIVDGVPDLHISDGQDTVNVMHWIDFDDPAHSDHARNLQVIRGLIEELSAFHSAYLAALHPESVTAGTPDAPVTIEVNGSS